MKVYKVTCTYIVFIDIFYKFEIIYTRVYTYVYIKILFLLIFNINININIDLLLLPYIYSTYASTRN